MKSGKMKISILLKGATGILLALFLASCAVNPATGRRDLALIPISTSQEIEIGEKTFPRAIQQMGGEITDPVLSAYVDRVGQSLGRVSHRPDLPYRFVVVNDSTPNAFALPGGFIGITRGLLLHMENEAQLAAVLGHEVGHVTARHAVQGLQRGALYGVALSVIGGVVAGEGSYGPLAQQAGELTAALLDRSHSREQERESDRLGIDYMIVAGYDPRGAVQLQEIFYRMEGGRDSRWLSGLFRTHPFSRDRMIANEEYVRMRYPDALDSASLSLGRESFDVALTDLRRIRQGYELYDRARSLERENRIKEAIVAYLDAATAAPSEPLILTGLGMAYLRAENHRAARPYLEQAVRLQGEYHLSRSGLGYAYLQQNEPERAVVHLEKAMELLPTVQSAFLLAESYEKTGEKEKAIVLYRAVAQADPQGRLGRAAEERLQVLTRV
jgi:beta-barrel assembly-enhancing protease